MRSFSDFHPAVLLLYFLCVTGIAMFCMHPVILILSLLGALALYFIRNGRHDGVSHLFFLLMFFIMALINPIVYHNGVTVLFVVNDNPVTLEALLYGIAASAMVIAVLYWFRTFLQVMTSDRLLYLFGAVSPKFALILSMALRYIPLYRTQTEKVTGTQTALGLYKEDNAIDSIRGGMRVFSVMVTWALENGIITADSMTARGYGTGRRTFYSVFRFRRSDAEMTAVILFLFGVTAAGAAAGSLSFAFYPGIGTVSLSPLSVAVYLSYGCLSFLPSFIEIAEGILWKHLQSGI